jgi:hypothetical protein
MTFSHLNRRRTPTRHRRPSRFHGHHQCRSRTIRFLDQRDAKRGSPPDGPIRAAARRSGARRRSGRDEAVRKVLPDDGGIGATRRVRQSPAQINIYVFVLALDSAPVLHRRKVGERRIAGSDGSVSDWHPRARRLRSGRTARPSWRSSSTWCRSASCLDRFRLIMWWELRGHRRWGVVAVVAGVVSFIVFTARL